MFDITTDDTALVIGQPPIGGPVGMLVQVRSWS